MKNFAYITARTEKGAVDSLGDKSLALAGGTDLLNLMKDYVIAPDALVNIKANRATSYGLLDPFTFDFRDPLPNNYLNVLRDPDYLFLAPSTFLTTGIVNTTNGVGFNNTGTNAKWQYFDTFSGGVDYHEMLTIKDPVTGASRLIVGNDQGVYTVVDRGEWVRLRDRPDAGRRVVAAARLVPLNAVQFYVQGAAGIVALWPLAYAMWKPARTRSAGRPRWMPATY